MIHVRAYDPGKATGWAELTVDNGKIVNYEVGEADLLEVGDRARIVPTVVDTVFVWEKYVMSTKISPSPWSLEVIGVVRYFAEHHGVPTASVLTSAHKTLIGSKVIRRAKLWVPGKPHAMDAASICMWYYVTKRRLFTEFLKDDTNAQRKNGSINE